MLPRVSSICLMYIICVGWVIVSRQGRCKTHQSLREVGQPGYRFLFVCLFCFVLAVAMAGGRLRSFYAGWRTLTPHKGNDRITQCDSVYMVRHRQDGYVATPWLSLEVDTPENIPILFHAVIHMQESLPRRRLLVRCSSPFMRLAQCPTALRAWC